MTSASKRSADPGDEYPYNDYPATAAAAAAPAVPPPPPPMLDAAVDGEPPSQQQRAGGDIIDHQYHRGNNSSNHPKQHRHQQHNNSNKPRRFCRAENCTRIVKSQGLCQRHGAKPRGCKVPGCPKQAQGNFDGMCKAHFKAHSRMKNPSPPSNPQFTGGGGGGVAPPPPPEGASVYDAVVPASVGWKPNAGGSSSMMPLVQHLKDGFDEGKPPAWHRNEERRARGLWPVRSTAQQLESWERELVWFEILLLTGTAGASFRHLARGWGRDKGFHTVLAQFICERHGDVERKKRVRSKRNNDNNNANNNNNGELADNNNYGGGGAGDGVVWDETYYGNAAYNEALAADLLHFEQQGAAAAPAAAGDNNSTTNQRHPISEGHSEASSEPSAEDHYVQATRGQVTRQEEV